MNKYFFPESDRYFIDRLRTILSTVLLQERTNSKELNPVIQKFVDFLDEFPEVAGSPLSIVIGHSQITCSEEEFGLHCYTSDWHEVFRNQYFAGAGGHHCIYGYDVINGEEKVVILNEYLDIIESDIEDLKDDIVIEDYSK